MRTGFLALLATLVAGVGMSSGQAPPPALPKPPPGPPMPSWSTVTSPVQVVGAAAPAADTKGDGSTTPAPETAAVVEVENGLSLPDGPNAFTDDPHALDKKKWIFPVWEGSDRVWFNAEYLLWWVRSAPSPGPLATTGTTASQGILGNPGTSTLFGDSNTEFGSLSGARFTLGYSNEDHTWAIEGTALWLQKGQEGFGTSSDAGGNPVLARPFINSLNGQESAALVSFPGAFAGNIQVSSSLEFSGAEINILHPLNQNLNGGVDFLIGARYLFLNENLGITQSSTLLPGGVLGFNGNTVLAPGVVSVLDGIGTRNQFTGGQVGLQADLHSGRLFLVMVGKVGLGDTHEVVNVNGQTTLSGTGAPAASIPGGLFAVGSNTGHSARDEFTVLPELMLSAGVEVTRNLRLFVGYNFLYWEDVVRPGDQVNRIVNPNLVPSSLSFGTGPTTPTPSNIGSHSDFWAQGVNFGVAIRY
ncbi:MAG TPA: BBP7 family outer membrane beta-barrel protein [Gemmataceae bacterium]|nr:BBP7 family outer membrane beta-barrel protein [Gemmataceae bacterium]